eukprot:357922-Chlamydomonas_euryale.AAC.7
MLSTGGAPQSSLLTMLSSMLGRLNPCTLGLQFFSCCEWLLGLACALALGAGPACVSSFWEAWSLHSLGTFLNLVSVRTAREHEGTVLALPAKRAWVLRAARKLGKRGGYCRVLYYIHGGAARGTAARRKACPPARPLGAHVRTVVAAAAATLAERKSRQWS